MSEWTFPRGGRIGLPAINARWRQRSDSIMLKRNFIWAMISWLVFDVLSLSWSKMWLLLSDQGTDPMVTKMEGRDWPIEPMTRFKYLLIRLRYVMLAVNGIGKWVKVNPGSLKSRWPWGWWLAELFHYARDRNSCLRVYEARQFNYSSLFYIQMKKRRVMGTLIGKSNIPCYYYCKLLHSKPGFKSNLQQEHVSIIPSAPITSIIISCHALLAFGNKEKNELHLPPVCTGMRTKQVVNHKFKWDPIPSINWDQAGYVN